jgi:hypothetical protein
MVGLRKRIMHFDKVIIRNQENQYIFTFYFFVHFFPPSRKSTQQLKKIFITYTIFFSSIFRWVAFGLIDGADLNLNGGMRLERFSSFSCCLRHLKFNALVI